MCDYTDKELNELLKKYFNHTNFKSNIQKDAIKSILSGRKNVYISMPTGSGKSLCYQLPGVIQENKITIVISPLIALIKNQIDYLLSKKIIATTINSTTGIKDREKIIADLKAKKTETKFLYITPEQAATHTFQDLFKLLFKFSKIAFVAVDEAHCVSNWGHDFRRDYLKLGEWRKHYPSISWLALTATAPLIVRQDIINNLNFHEPTVFQVPCFRKNLYYDIIYKNSLKDDFIELKDYIHEILEKSTHSNVSKSSEKPCAIIYCRKKETTESVALGLRKQGLSCKAFHSGLKKSEKDQVQDDWMNGKVAVIVATVAFGMGIDHQHVRLVVHWDLSQSISAYYQESGRAGRDGKKSYCRLYYDRDEVRSITFLLNQDLKKIKDIKSEEYLRAKNAIKEFEKIVEHCENIVCRHLLFTKYFGDPNPDCSSMCDVCKNKKNCIKRLEVFQQLSARASLGSGFRTVAEEADYSDLYEGGRKSSKGAFDNYENDSGNEYGSSFRKASDIERKKERSFIDKQFALRKMQAAAAMQMNETASISRVKMAAATETKVSGLTISTRECNLSIIVSSLKANMEKCALINPSQMPKVALVHKDLEDIGIDIEFKCFDSCKAVSIYRRNIAKETYGIKMSNNLYPAIRDHIPKKHKSFGGDYKTIVRDLKNRFGEDVIDEIESEIKLDSDKKRIKKEQNQNRDGMNQSKISSYFVKKPKVEIESDESEKLVIDLGQNEGNDDADVSKLEQLKLALEDELKQFPIKTESQECKTNYEAIQETKTQEYLINDDDKKNIKKVSIKTFNETDNERKRKADTEIYKETSVKHSCLNNGFKKASEMVATSSSHDKIAAKRSRNKNTISEIVINTLNQFYHDKKIMGDNPKGLFKAIARKVTHRFYDKNPDVVNKKEIKDYIFEVFYNRGTISSLTDFELN